MDIFDLPLDLTKWSWAHTYAAAQVLSQIIALLNIPSVLLRRSRRPMSQLAWILCLLALPFLGILMWWAFGRTHLVRKRRRRAKALEAVSRSLESLSAQALTPVAQEEYLQRLREQPLLIDDNGVFRTTPENHVEVLVSGREAFPAFAAAIRDAKYHVHLQFYIWQTDDVGARLRDLLIEKAREGVEVRVLYDAFGAAALEWKGFMKPLQKVGGHVAPFLPFRLERSMRMNFRNHRKIIVVDGKTGFVGGLNVGDEYNEWYDTAMRVSGPVVNQLQEVFAEDWYFATKENLVTPDYFCGRPAPTEAENGVATNVLARVIASGPDSWESVTHSMFFIAITSAEDRIWITTPYFIPDLAIMTALKTAALRGIDVRLMLPGKSDVPVARWAGRGYFEELLGSGVRIFEYQPSVLHAKILLFDDEWTIAGSANLDNRSFHLQFEVNLAMVSRAVNHRFAQEFETRLAQCVEIRPEVWSKRGTPQRLGETAARLLSPML